MNEELAMPLSEEELGKVKKRMDLFINMIFYGLLLAALPVFMLLCWSRAKLYNWLCFGPFTVGMVICIGGLILNTWYLWNRSMTHEDFLKVGLTADNIFTKKRMRVAICSVLATVIIMLILNATYPIETMPETLSHALFFVGEDRDKIMSTEVGIVAETYVDPIGTTHFWPCSSIKAYGPFQYAGGMDEIGLEFRATKTLYDPVTDAKLEDSREIGLIMVYFVGHEDGTWMVVKQFDYNAGKEIPEHADAFLLAMDTLDEVPYEIHEFTIDDRIDRVLGAATNDMLSFEKTGEGYVWTLSE